MTEPDQPCLWSYVPGVYGLKWWECGAHGGMFPGDADTMPPTVCDSADTSEEDTEPPYNPRNDPWSPHYEDGIPRGLTPEALADYTAREEAQHFPHRP